MKQHTPVFHICARFRNSTLRLKIVTTPSLYPAGEDNTFTHVSMLVHSASDDGNSGPAYTSINRNKVHILRVFENGK